MLIASPASSSGTSANIEGALEGYPCSYSYLEGTAFGLVEVATARLRHSASIAIIITSSCTYSQALRHSYIILDKCRALGGGASLSEHARCVSVLVIEVTMIVLMNNNHVNTIEENELGIMWVLADTDPACL